MWRKKPNLSICSQYQDYIRGSTHKKKIWEDWFVSSFDKRTQLAGQSCLKGSWLLLQLALLNWCKLITDLQSQSEIKFIKCFDPNLSQWLALHCLASCRWWYAAQTLETKSWNLLRTYVFLSVGELSIWAPMALRGITFSCRCCFLHQKKPSCLVGYDQKACEQ